MTLKEQKAAYMREWSRKNPEKVKASKKRSYWKNKEQDNARSKVWRTENKEYKSAKDKEYQELNKEKIALNKRQYYLKNRIKFIQYAGERTKFRRKTDTLFYLKGVLRTQIVVNLVARKYKKSITTESLLGAKIEIVRVHLESMFKPGMTWENHGLWHIDHIIPLASAKNKEDIYELFHYKNLQPLWASENLIKGGKYTNP